MDAAEALNDESRLVIPSERFFNVPALLSSSPPDTSVGRSVFPRGQIPPSCIDHARLRPFPFREYLLGTLPNETHTSRVSGAAPVGSHSAANLGDTSLKVR